MPKLEKVKSLTDKLLPMFIALSFIMAFVIGILWEKVSSLEKGGGGSTTPSTSTDNTQQAQPQAQAGQVAVTQDQIKKLFSQDLIKFGDDKKKVLFVAVEDPSCPYCHIASGLNPELNNQSGDRFKLVSEGGTYVAPVPEMEKLVNQGKASLVYIYTPGHGNGEMGMKALYCAFDEGKFWQAHNLLFTSAGYDLLNNKVKNDKTKSGDIAEFLKSAVDQNKLKSCLDSGKYDDRLSSDTTLAASIGVKGTPGFYVNTTNFAGAYSWKDMESAVTSAL